MQPNLLHSIEHGILSRYGSMVCVPDESSEPMLLSLVLQRAVLRSTLLEWLSKPESKDTWRDPDPNRIVFPLQVYNQSRPHLLPQRITTSLTSEVEELGIQHLCLNGWSEQDKITPVQLAKHESFQGTICLGISRRWGPFSSFEPVRRQTTHKEQPRFLSRHDLDRVIRELWHDSVLLWMGHAYIPTIEAKNGTSSISSYVQEARAWLRTNTLVSVQKHVPKYIQAKCPQATLFHRADSAAALFEEWSFTMWNLLVQPDCKHQHVDLQSDTIELHWILDMGNDRDAIQATLTHSPTLPPGLKDPMHHWFQRYWNVYTFQTHSLPHPPSSLQSLPHLSDLETKTLSSPLSKPSSTEEEIPSMVSPSEARTPPLLHPAPTASMSAKTMTPTQGAPSPSFHALLDSLESLPPLNLTSEDVDSILKSTVQATSAIPPSMDQGKSSSSVGSEAEATLREIRLDETVTVASSTL